MSEPKAPRPAHTDLPPVGDEEYLYRRIPPDGYDDSQPDGMTLTNAMIHSFDLKPDPTSYGWSTYVESMLPNGLESLGDLDPKWRTCGLVRVPVGVLRQFDVTVCYSPQDCDYAEADDAVKAAHASVIGIETKAKRTRLIRALEGYVWRRPPP
jgi:hypothetical protein